MLLQGSGIALDDTLRDSRILWIPEGEPIPIPETGTSNVLVMCPSSGSAIVLPLRKIVCWTLLANVAYFVLGIHVIVREAPTRPVLP